MGDVVTGNKPERFGYLRQKLKNWGVDNKGMEAVLERIHITGGSTQSHDIIPPGRLPGHGTVLLDGVACLYERQKDGSRQIFDFQYSGDFCDLNRHVLPASNAEIGVAAITNCSIGTIKHRDFEDLMAQYSSLGLAVWRAAMLEASIFRKSLLNGRRPALERVAHLLCEFLARREAVGISSSAIPVSQIDLADATGLSFVHVSRTIKELQTLRLLVKEGRTIKVVDRKQLAYLAAFDGNYLKMPQLLAGWQVEIEHSSTPATVSG